MYSDLKDRRLWFDGVSQVQADKVVDSLFQGSKIHDLSVFQLSEDVERYNSGVSKNERLSVKVDIDDTRLVNLGKWKLPFTYKYDDVIAYLTSLASKIDETDTLYESRLERLVAEISRFEAANMLDLVMVIKFVLERFTERGVIWGVGRGSSCASYIFHLMGLHEVDPVFYDIDIDEFLKGAGNA